ncbi:hypothetical protein QT15_04625 [Pseudoalteromonas flavipulchra NCIMB 2033 = ATCC BAA-314]|nr:hypothetical protein QT15_04625 [Pseudoalteromonas flavipulchra NCIMB 2033 = ATCC BAA-314]
MNSFKKLLTCPKSYKFGKTGLCVRTVITMTGNAPYAVGDVVNLCDHHSGQLFCKVKVLAVEFKKSTAPMWFFWLMTYELVND